MLTVEKQAYEMANESTRLWEMHACERHAYGMAYARCTPMRDTPMGRLLWEARL